MFWELKSKGLQKSSGEEKESCSLLFPSSTKREFRHLHVVVVQRRQRKVQKSVMHVQICCFANVRPCPYASVFIWKRYFFFTDTASVHTYPMKTVSGNWNFWKRSPGWNFLKPLFSRVRVDRRKRNFSKTLRTYYQFHCTPRNIRETYSRWRTGALLSCLLYLGVFLT